MASTRDLPDLVTDTRLRVEVHETHTHYFNVHIDYSSGHHLRRHWKKEMWTRRQRLGRGAFGEVWLEECHTSEKKGQLQAVKVISKSKSGHFDYYQELEAIAKFSQSTIKYEGLFVKSLGWYEDEESIFIVMEYIEHGNLASHLNQPLPEDESKQITIQVLEGLAALHENGFAHRDLKPENILVTSKGPRWWVKIGDFGFSKRVSEDNSLHSLVGTQNYFAPEVLGLYPQGVDLDRKTISSRYTCVVDMWSLGVTVFYMLCHDFPFKNGLLLAYINGAPFPLNMLLTHNISQEGCAFIEALLTVDPSTRLAAAAALENPWLTGPNYEVPSRVLEQLPENLPPVIQNQFADLSLATYASKSWPVDSTRIPHEPTRGDQPLTTRGAVSESGIPPGLKPALLYAGDSETKILDDLRALHESGLAFMADKKYTTAEARLQQAADGREAVLGPFDKDTLVSKQQLGVVYLLQNRYEDARRTLQYTSDFQTKFLGQTHVDTLSSNYWLCRALLEEEQFQAAHDILEQTRDTQRAILGPRHNDTIKSLYLTGQIYYRQEKYDDALIFFKQAVDAWKELFGPGHSTTLEALQSLGRCLHKQEKYKGALSVFQEVVKASPSETGSQQTLTYLHETGQALYRAGEYATAQGIFEQVSQSRKELLGPEHEETLDSLVWLGISLRLQPDRVIEARDLWQQIVKTSALGATKQFAFDQLHDIAKMLWRQKAYTKARALFEEELQARTEIGGQRNQDTLAAAHWLGRTLCKQGMYDQATKLLISTETDQQLTLGSQHLDTVYTRLWLGHSLYYQGQMHEAHSIFYDTSLALHNVLGPKHEDTLMCNRYLGCSLIQLERYGEAERILQKTWAIAKIALGPAHEETLSTHITLGIARYVTGQYKDAVVYFQQAAGHQTATLGKNHAETLSTLCWIGEVLDGMSRYQESEGFWRQVAEAREQVLGADHPKMQTAIRWLAISLENQCKWGEAAELHRRFFTARYNHFGPYDPATIESSEDVERCRKALRGQHVKVPRKRRPTGPPLL